jgi:hypothetical protein
MEQNPPKQGKWYWIEEDLDGDDADLETQFTSEVDSYLSKVAELQRLFGE